MVSEYTHIKILHFFLHKNFQTFDIFHLIPHKAWIVIGMSHIKIFIILIKLIFQNIFFNKFCGISPTFYGGIITFAVEVWSWKLCQIKDPLALEPQSAVPWISRESKHRAVERVKTTWHWARCFDALDSAMFWLTEPRIGASNTNGS